eukprot:366119-Chlamydomonas_euryale.AAC.12
MLNQSASGLDKLVCSPDELPMGPEIDAGPVGLGPAQAYVHVVWHMARVDQSCNPLEALPRPQQELQRARKVKPRLLPLLRTWCHAQPPVTDV